MRRIILHVDLDAFFVEVERLNDPGLRGRAVIVGGDPDGRGVVSSASYEARACGVHSALPMSQARRLCPHGVFVRVGTSDYGAYSRRARAVFEQFSPLVQMNSIDEAYLDLTGTELLHGPPLQAADALRRAIGNQVRLPCSCGLGANKLVSKVASDAAKPGGLLWIQPGREAEFFAHLPPRKLPGVGKQLARRLEQFQLRTLGDVQRLSRETLSANFGAGLGAELFARCRGQSDSPVVPEREAKSISHETTFERDVADPARLETTLSWLCEKTARRLRGQQLLARTVQLKLRYADFTTITRSVTLPEPGRDDREFYLAAAALLRAALRPAAKVRLIGVGVSNFTDAHWQLDFLEIVQQQKAERLARALDRIKDRHGAQSIVWAQSRKKP